MFNWRNFKAGLIGAAIGAIGVSYLAPPAEAQAQPAQQAKPNILFIVSDDTGFGDLGPYGGGVGRGMPTPNIDKMAAQGMTFFTFYAQPPGGEPDQRIEPIDRAGQLRQRLRQTVAPLDVRQLVQDHDPAAFHRPIVRLLRQ